MTRGENERRNSAVQIQGEFDAEDFGSRDKPDALARDCGRCHADAVGRNCASCRSDDSDQSDGVAGGEGCDRRHDHAGSPRRWRWWRRTWWRWRLPRRRWRLPWWRRTFRRLPWRWFSWRWLPRRAGLSRRRLSLRRISSLWWLSPLLLRASPLPSALLRRLLSLLQSSAALPDHLDLLRPAPHLPLASLASLAQSVPLLVMRASLVMPGLVPGIHGLSMQVQERGWPGRLARRRASRFCRP